MVPEPDEDTVKKQNAQPYPHTLSFFSTVALPNKAVIIFWDSLPVSSTIEIKLNELNIANNERPFPILKRIKEKQVNNRRIIAAILAFPFPFGIVGLHRIYLGTKPYVPIAYIASLGGIFGILPLIDFFVLAFDKDFEHYENNSKVMMWVK